jgi:hypothetical protein
MYLMWILLTGVDRISDVSDILTFSISRLCHGYSKEVLNFGNTSHISTCCHPKTEFRNTMKAINLPCRPYTSPSKYVTSIIWNSDYEVSKSFTFLRHITNCHQISVESRTRAVWNSSFLNMYILITRKFLGLDCNWQYVTRGVCFTDKSWNLKWRATVLFTLKDTQAQQISYFV